jgi:HEAT repeat protein
MINRTLAALFVFAFPVAGADERADAIVRELGNFEPAIRSFYVGPPPARIPAEERRRELYNELLELQASGVDALARGLDDAAVGVRQNASLALSVLSGGWMLDEKLDISAALPSLIRALDDSDELVRARSAHAIGAIGPGAEAALPALLELLKNRDEGSRIGACIAFKGIGPPAASALPALRRALGDRSTDVREFAQRAIDAIEQA